MGLFSNRPPATESRMLGELLAIRLTLQTTLVEISGDFGPGISGELIAARTAGLTLATERGYPAEVSEGFDDFMRSFIAAARRHA